MLDKHESADNRRTTFFLNFESKLSRNTRPLQSFADTISLGDSTTLGS